MLIYHPAYDAYHCVFRSVLLTNYLNEIEVAKLRLLDFYLTFPAELSKASLPKELSHAKKVVEPYLNRYHGPVSGLQTFKDMEHIQMSAFGTLAATEIFDADNFSKGLIKRSTSIIFPEMQERILHFEEENKDLLNLIVKDLSSIPLLGDKGLKKRTNLMEYKYDAN